MALTDIKREFNRMEKAEIIKLISELYRKVPAAKEFLDIYATGDVKTLVDKYKREIEKYVYPKGRDMVMHETEARKLIRTVRKMNITELNVELELHYVKCCLDMVKDFGFCDDSYYAAMERLFRNAMEGIAQMGREDDYQLLVDELADKASEYGIELI